MEKINFTLVSSLEHLSLFKIAITLWKAHSDRYSANEIYSVELEGFGKLFEIESEKPVTDLQLPVRIKVNVLKVYKIVCMEIKLWIKLHSTFLSKDFHWLRNADWKLIGTLDHKSTALKLVRDENVPLMDRYKLACTYCFEDYIPVLYNKLEEGQNYDFERETVVLDLGFSFLTNVWRLKIEENRYFSDHQIFIYAAFCGNKAAAEYFYQKLSIQTKDEWLVKTADFVVSRYSTAVPSVVYSKMLFFLLQQMSVEQVCKLMQRKAYDVLKCFLEWPLQYHFMTMTKYAWYYLNESSYNNILSAIALKSAESYQYWDYVELGREFCQQRSDTCNC